MKKILIVSSRKITSAETIEELESFFKKFIVVHLFLEEKKEEIPEDISGVVFNADTDSMEIDRIKEKMPKDIPKVRIYSSFWGYDQIPDVKVRQTKEEASLFIEGELLN